MEFYDKFTDSLDLKIKIYTAAHKIYCLLWPLGPAQQCILYKVEVKIAVNPVKH